MCWSRSFARAALVAGSLVWSALPVAATDVSGSITSNTTWTLANSPYVVTGNVTVNAGATLTVEPGVEVKFNAARQIDVFGTLIAEGTQASPIVFTANSATPTPGSWDGLHFRAPVAGAPTSRLAYATVSYGGAWSNWGMVNINANPVQFDHVTISHSSKHGMEIWGSASPVISASTFANNVQSGIDVSSVGSGFVTLSDTSFTANGYAITADANVDFRNFAGLTFSNNGAGAGNGVFLRGGTVSGTKTWGPSGVWDISAYVTVGTGATLTVAPGTTVKFRSGVGLTVSGTLLSQGTAASPIVFTSISPSPAPGAWHGIALEGVGQPISSFAYTTVSYGGGWAKWGMVDVLANSPQFDHVTISRGSQHGMEIFGAASPIITASSFQDNVQSGIDLTNVGGGFVTTSDTSFTGNGYAITADANVDFRNFSGMTFSGNGGGAGNGVKLRGGTVTGAKTWGAAGVWDISGFVTIAANATLTVAPGTTVKFRPGTGVENVGRLLAEGTASSPIVFTSINASPSPGNWGGIRFAAAAGQGTSRLAYATVSYGGGWSYWGMVDIAANSPQIDHLTISRGSQNGMEIWGAASPVISASSFQDNVLSGIDLTNAGSGGFVTMSGTSFTGNGYAITADANVDFRDFSGMSFSGNGGGAGNGVYLRGGTITGSKTWWPSGTWDVSAGISVGSGATLTVAPGAIVKFRNGVGLDVVGSLLAEGTPAAPILFSSTQASPTPGSWAGLQFRTCAGPVPSRVAHATVSYGGNWGPWSVVEMNGCAANLDHVMVTHSSKVAVGVWGAISPVLDFVSSASGTAAGMQVDFGGTPVLRNTSFLGPVAGGLTVGGSVAVNARLSYWGSPTGPSGIGPGTGRPVTGQVLYEPWLAAQPSDAHRITSVAASQGAFNPAQGANHQIDFATSGPGDWVVTYLTSADVVLRTFTGQGSLGAVAWDGKDESGAAMTSGTYRYRVESVGAGGVSAQARGRAILDTSASLSVSGLVLTQTYISPNADAIQESTSYSGSFNSSVSWTVEVKAGEAPPVRTFTGSGATFAITWDGRNGAGVVVPDSPYTLALVATTGVATTSAQATVVLDVAPPTTVISSPTAPVLSNVYQSGVVDVPILGSASDVNMSSWTLEYGTGATPASWVALASGSVNSTAPQLALWKTLERTNGTYTLRLRGADRAGNSAQALRTMQIGNFSASQNVGEFNPGAGQTVTYTSIVPFELTETLTLRNEAGAIVRTLVPGTVRNQGTFPDVWNGRNDADVLVADGAHFYVATVTDGTNTLTWDLTNTFYPGGNGFNDWLVLSQYDPFNNKPLTFYFYPSSNPSRITIAFSPDRPVPPHCNPPNFCIKNDKYVPSGWQFISWAGVDATGAFRPDIRSVAAIMKGWNFAKNAVVVFGTAPTITNLKVTPPMYGPAVGEQEVSFDLTTYQSQAVQLQVRFKNQASLSDLRTITVPAQTPGNVELVWDGRADNGMWVAPGRYTVTVTALDAFGNSVSSQILTTILY